MKAIGRLLRALGALGVAAAVLAGVPAVLSMVGWPLPDHVPSLEELQRALSPGALTVDALVKLLVVGGWLLWALVVAGSAVEVAAVLRRRQAPSLPGLRPVQGFSRWLVTSLTLSLSGGLNAAAPVLAHAMAPPPAAAVAVASPAAAAPQAPTAAPTPTPTYVVQRNDSLVGIAEATLGAPERWREIFDLNHGRPQATGGALRSAGVIRAGWVLRLPADASVAVTGAGPASQTTLPEQDHVVAAGENMWSTAERRLADAAGTAVGDHQVAPYWSEVVATNAGTVRSGDADLIYPGEHLRLPPVAANGGVAEARVEASPPPPLGPVDPPPGAPASDTDAQALTPATPGPSQDPITPSAPAPPPEQAPASPSESTPAPPPSSRDGNGAVDPWAARVAFAAALGLPTFALAGWLAKLRRGRVAQASRCRPGRDVVRSADPETETLERRARAIATDEAEEWVDASLRALTATLGRSSLPPPQIRCVRAGDLGVEVLLAETSAAAPEGWELADEGHVWRCPPQLSLDQLRAAGEGQVALTPALVSLGATPEGPVLVDLEGLGVLAVEGDAERARAFLAGVALELGTASWADGVELRVHGLTGFDDAGTVADGAALIDELRASTDLAGQALGSHGSALAARVADSAEPWYPMVVVAGPDAGPAVVQEMAELAAPGTGVALVAAGAVAGADWQLVVAPDGAAVLKPLGLGLRVGGVAEVPPRLPSETAQPDDDFVDTGLSAIDGGAGAEPDSSGPALDHGGGDFAPAAELMVDQGGLDQAAIGLAASALSVVAELDDVAAPTPFASPRKSSPAKLRRRRDCEVWVSVLRRSPEITGWAQVSGRRKLAEVLVYLSIYGAERPVPGAELRAECWPPKLDEPVRPGSTPRLRDVTPEAFHQAMSRLRKQLGQGSAGWHLPPAVDGAYSPGPGVGCDYVLFQALVVAASAAAARQDTGKAIALYREALELVDGEPFVDVPPGSYGWVHSKHLVTDMSLAVSKAASDLAKIAIASEPHTAAWAAQQGLLLLPTQLELFDHWMIAAAEMGDGGALERSLQATCWAHEQLSPDGGIAPETMELYRRLKAKLADKQVALGGQGG